MVCITNHILKKKLTIKKNKIMEIKNLTITEAFPFLNDIALCYGLRLNRAKEFKLARAILVNLYCRESI